MVAVDVLVAEAEPFHHAGPEVLDEDVGGGDQAPRLRGVIGVAEVERDAALVAVDRLEVGRAAVRVERRAP